MLGARLVVMVAVVAAIVVQLASSIEFANRDGQPDTADVTVNFLSYFTIDSNTFTAVILLVGAIVLMRGTPVEPHWFTVARMAVTA